MNPAQKSACDSEIAEARALLARGDLPAAQARLERAHVLGQAWVIPHVKSHWLMFRVEVRRRRPVAAAGQAVRMLFGGIGSAIGVLPEGNTGSSDVNMFRRMPIDPALKKVIDGEEPGKAPEQKKP